MIGSKEDFNLEIITNLIRVPATPTAIISFINQVSLKMTISSPITVAARITEIISVIFLKGSKQIETRSWK
jgi:hypothetical protein